MNTGDIVPKAFVNTKIMNNENSFQKVHCYKRGSNFSKNSSGHGKICSQCGKLNHTIETYYRKHGCPPGFKFRNSGSSAYQFTVEGSATCDIQSMSMAKDTSTCTGSNALFTSLTQNQVQQLLALTQQPNSSEILYSSNQVITGKQITSLT